MFAAPSPALYKVTFAVIILLAELQLNNACSCMHPQNVSQELNRATSVFMGNVTEIDPGVCSFTNDTFELIMTDAMITFGTLDKIWKSNNHTVIDGPDTTVFTTPSSGPCGGFCGYPNFQIGEKYIVYTYSDDNRVHLCGRTTHYNLEEEVQLDNITVPSTDPIEDCSNNVTCSNNMDCPCDGYECDWRSGMCSPYLSQAQESRDKVLCDNDHGGIRRQCGDRRLLRQHVKR